MAKKRFSVTGFHIFCGVLWHVYFERAVQWSILPQTRCKHKQKSSPEQMYNFLSHKIKVLGNEM